eukprot:2572476-Prymnesium_polylepis.1
MPTGPLALTPTGPLVRPSVCAAVARRAAVPDVLEQVPVRRVQPRAARAEDYRRLLPAPLTQVLATAAPPRRVDAAG